MQETGNNQHKTYSLSIRISADGFSFYCCSPQFLPAIENESYRFDTDSNQAAVIEKALSTSNLLKRNYTTVQCLIAGPSIQIPLEYFRKEEATAFYQLSYAETEARKTYYNILPSLEIAEVFTVDKTVEEVLRQHFPQIRFFHIHTMLLEKMALQPASENQHLYVYLHDKSMFTFCFNGQQLEFANTFAADETGNLTYFLLSVWKDLEFDAEKDVCVFLGNHTLIQDVTASLSKYIRHINKLPASQLYRRSSLAQAPDVPLDILTLLLNIV